MRSSLMVMVGMLSLTGAFLTSHTTPAQASLSACTYAGGPLNGSSFADYITRDIAGGTDLSDDCAVQNVTNDSAGALNDADVFGTEDFIQVRKDEFSNEPTSGTWQFNPNNGNLFDLVVTAKDGGGNNTFPDGPDGTGAVVHYYWEGLQGNQSGDWDSMFVTENNNGDIVTKALSHITLYTRARDPREEPPAQISTIGSLGLLGTGLGFLVLGQAMGRRRSAA